MKALNVALAEVIKVEIDTRDTTAASVSRESGIPSSTLRDHLKHGELSVHELAAIAEALEVSPVELLARADHRRRPRRPKRAAA